MLVSYKRSNDQKEAVFRILDIRKVDRDDAGNYTCVAITERGSKVIKSSSLKVHVKGKHWNGIDI